MSFSNSWALCRKLCNSWTLQPPFYSSKTYIYFIELPFETCLRATPILMLRRYLCQSPCAVCSIGSLRKTAFVDQNAGSLLDAEWLTVRLRWIWGSEEVEVHLRSLTKFVGNLTCYLLNAFWCVLKNSETSYVIQETLKLNQESPDRTINCHSNSNF
jgi:hypothetical protein